MTASRSQVPSGVVPSRPPRVFWWFVGTAGGVALLLAAVWLLVGWRYASGEPTPSVDHAARMRALAPPAEGGSAAWPILSRSMEDWGGEISSPLSAWADRVYGPPERWEASSLAEASAWLAGERNLERLRDLVEVPLRHPRLGLSFEAGGGPVPLSSVWDTGVYGTLRQVARLLQAEARRATDAGDTEAAERAVRSMLRVADMCDDVPLAVSTLVSLSIRQLAADTLGGLLRVGGLGGEALIRLDAAFEQTAAAAAASPVFAGERLYAADEIQRMYTDDGGGAGRITPEGLPHLAVNGRWVLETLLHGEAEPEPDSAPLWEVLAGPIVLHLSPSRAEFAASTERVLTLAETLWREGRGSPQGRAAIAGLEASHAPEPAGRWGRIGFVLNPHNRAAAFRDQEPMLALHRTREVLAERLHGVRLALAAERFRLARGRLPATVAELRGAGLTDSSGRGVAGRYRFAARGGRFVVYADGADGDDDGGHPPGSGGGFAGFPPLASSPPPPPDGDAVLFTGGPAPPSR